MARSSGTESILAVGAHPDDIELGCGATLALHRKLGHTVHMLVMTRGTASFAAHHSIQRAAEQQHASDELGADLWWGSSIDCQIIDGYETIQTIENVINSVRPDQVYVHNPDDTHQDHRIISVATLSAARRVPSVLYYQSPSSLHFDPSVFVDVSNTLDQKIAALACHESQKSTGVLDADQMRANARYWGHFARCQYAEPFTPARLLWSL